MTFNDYAVECGLYECSQEYFDLMKECSELALTERFIMNQLVLQEDASTFGITDDITITESFLMESVNESDLQAMYEKAEEKKTGIWSKFINWIKRGLAAIGKWFLHLAGIEHDDMAAQLEAEIKNGVDLSKRLETVEARLKNTGIHIKNQIKQVDDLRSQVASRDKKIKDQEGEIEKKDRQLKGAHEALGKAQKERGEAEKALQGKNRKISELSKDNAEKGAEIKRQQDENTKLGKEVTKFADLADQYKEAAALLQKKVNVMLDANKLPSACDPEVLCEVMSEMATLIKSSYDSNGMMIKATRVRQITKKLDDAIAEQRAGKMTINFAKKTFTTCNARMEKSLQALNSMQSAAESSFDSEAANLIREAMGKISKAQSDTMSLVSQLAQMRNSVMGQGVKKGKAKAKEETKAKQA